MDLCNVYKQRGNCWNSKDSLQCAKASRRPEEVTSNTANVCDIFVFILFANGQVQQPGDLRVHWF